jgi:hypothetical protein
MSYVYRYDLINQLIKKFGFKNYLEIGVSDPSECFDNVICENKMGVDPGLEFPDNPVKYPMTSDNFFLQLENGKLDLDPGFRWDIIFIDGLHISTQVMKDVINSLYHLNPNGYILLHDCNPETYFMQREDYYIDGVQHPWNGTVWKVIYNLRATRDDLQVCTVNTDWGVGVIRRGNFNPIKFDNPFYEYNQMSNFRRRDLGIIEVHEFEHWINT